MELNQIGAQHPMIKQVLAIQRNTAPNPRRMVTAEGLWAHNLFLENDIFIDTFLWCPEAAYGDEARKRAVELASRAHLAYQVSEKMLARISERLRAANTETLNGSDNYEIDREVLRQVQWVVPEIAQTAWDNRNFLIRVTRFIASQTGVTQFLDCGSGLPTAENTHQVAQRIQPDARVVYVDNDPVVLAHGRALLHEDDHTHFSAADIFTPHQVINDEVVRRGVSHPRRDRGHAPGLGADRAGSGALCRLATRSTAYHAAGLRAAVPR